MIDESMKEEIRVTVIATGFDQQQKAATGLRGSANEAIRPAAATLEELDIPEFLRRRK